MWHNRSKLLFVFLFESKNVVHNWKLQINLRKYNIIWVISVKQFQMQRIEKSN